MFTTVGLNYIFDTYFGSRAKVSNWYVGIISATSFSSVAVSDTPASHSGWTEYTDYAETTRQLITFGTSSGGIDTNPTVVQFTANSDASIAGWFLTEVNTKGSTSGIIPCLSTFLNGTQSVKAGNIEQFTLTLTALNSL